MDDLQQKILEIAMQLPGYLGYEAKERRRDMDKYTRGQLAAQYGELDTYLARIQKKAPLDHIVDLENLDQKLQRLIARFNTAPRGYAGWFDSAQIVENDLDALTEFDATLVNGVPQLKDAFDKISVALKKQDGIADAIAECAELLDTLNARFDQREQFLATGKKPSLATLPKPAESPLSALDAKRTVPQEIIALTHLKINDAVSYNATDYIIAGKATYTIPAGTFWAFLLDSQSKLWLRVGPGGEIVICQEIQYHVPSPLPDSLTYGNQTFTRGDAGQANVLIEGASGVKRGSVSYARYSADAGQRLWIEDFGADQRTLVGQTADASEIKIYRR